MFKKQETLFEKKITVLDTFFFNFCARVSDILIIENNYHNFENRKQSKHHDNHHKYLTKLDLMAS